MKSFLIYYFLNLIHQRWEGGGDEERWEYPSAVK